jgi:predicted secreted protein
MGPLVLHVRSTDVSAQIARGAIVALIFDEDPATGFLWRHLTPAPSMLIAMEDTFVSADNGVGTTGKRTFRFECIEKGEAELRFALARPWQVDELIEVRTIRLNCG